MDAHQLQRVLIQSLTVLARTRCLAVLSLLLAQVAVAQFHAVELGALSQSGGQAGTEFELRVVTGTRLDEIDRLRFSHPAITAELITSDPLPFREQREPQFGTFKVTIAADAPLGRHEVRSIGRHGVSNSRPFWVTALPSLVQSSVSHDQAAPSTLPFNTVSHATTSGAEIDFYAVPAEQGQRIEIDLSAQALDSWLIPYVKVFGPQGRLVATARGSDGVDPKLVFEAQASANYVVAVHDFLYRGGGDFFYQLVARTGEESERTHPHQPTAAWTHPSQVSAPTWSDATETLEGEVAKISPPCAVAGHFETPDDVDSFEFDATKGEVFAIDVDLAPHRTTDGRSVAGPARPAAAIRGTAVATGAHRRRQLRNRRGRLVTADQRPGDGVHRSRAGDLPDFGS